MVFVSVFVRAGDGTTTSTLLTQEIVNQGMRLVTSGANPVELRQGILAAAGFIIERIKEMAVPVGKNEARFHVTTESSDHYELRTMLMIYVFKGRQMICYNRRVPRQ